MGRTKGSGWLYKLDSKKKMRVWSMDINEADDGSVWQTIESGLKEGNHAKRNKEITDSKVECAWDRAVKLLRNTIVKKKREGYDVNEESAKHAPTLTKPMKAQTYKPDGKPLPQRLWVQPKVNGLRCMYFPEEDKLFTKSGLTYFIPEIMDHVRTLSELMGGAVLDGELFIPDTPVATIKSITSHLDDPRRKNMNYHVFDVISEDILETRIQKLKDGFYELKETVPIYQSRVVWVPTEFCCDGPEQLKERYEHYLSQGWEGLMIRINGSLYESGKRSKNLLKWKPVYDAEFEVVHITYEHRMMNGVQYKLVEFHCYDPMSDSMFKCVPKWDVERRFQWYKDYGETHLDLVIDTLPPLNVEFRERTKNNVPFHAVAIDFREEGY